MIATQETAELKDKIDGNFTKNQSKGFLTIANKEKSQYNCVGFHPI